MLPVIIGVSGGTGAGKTTVARRIITELKNDSVILIHHDFYYKDLNYLVESEREKVNFDHPDAFDNTILIEHMVCLKRGEKVAIPQYDFNTHTRKKEVITIGTPVRVVLLEGIMILADVNIRNCLDMKIYVDADADIRILRRLERDVKERGRTFDSVLSQYYKTVRPMHLEFVEPSKRWADIIIPNAEYNDIGINMIVRTIQSLLNVRN
jgi:uridine kinase